MKLSQGVAAVLLLVSGAAAQAELSGTVGVVSDYDFRGISLSAKDPALQGSIDWAAESGFYVGAWASNIDYGDDYDGNIELDLYAGYAGETAGGLGWDVGLVWYTYPDSSSSSTRDKISSYPEIYVGLSYEWLEFKQWYTNDLEGSDDDGFYTEANASFELPADFALNLHAGYSWGDGFDSPEVGFRDSQYMDYSIGVGYTLGNFDLELKWVDTDLDEGDYRFSDDDVFSSEGRVIFGVSTTFPWGGEE